MSEFEKSQALGNRILASLPRDECERLAPHLRETSLSVGAIPYDFDEPITDINFPNTDTLGSLLPATEHAAAIEIGATGNGGRWASPS